MKYYIGIDGGGSKTIFAISGEDGKILGTVMAGSAFYKQIGEEGVIELLKNGVKEVCAFAEGENTKIASVCFGMPAWGESPANDKVIEQKILSTFPEWNIQIVNDCEMGWAGSLLAKPGINIVAGTGSIAFGKNEDGKTARSGGWSEWFGDEGSGYWLGMKCVQLFTRQAARELYDIVRGVKKQIFAGKACTVSCSGGIFKVGDLIRKPFMELLAADGMELTDAKAEPYVGAVLLTKYYESR